MFLENLRIEETKEYTINQPNDGNRGATLGVTAAGWGM